MIRLVKPPIFVSKRTDAGDVSAMSQAASWLDEICGDDFEPVNLTVRGSNARVELTPREEPDALIVLRRRTASVAELAELIVNIQREGKGAKSK